MQTESEDFGEWYIEFVVGDPKYNRKSPPYMIKLKDLAKERAKHGDAEAYTSIHRYPSLDPYAGPMLSGFLLDFDSADDPERARREAIIAVKELIRRYHVPEESIGICPSGGKGFHVSMNRRVFNMEPSAFHPQICKSMAQELAEQCRLKTLDVNICDCRRLWRLPNSKHPSGYYKVHITMSELENLSMEKIRELATKPRTTVAIVPKYSPEAEAWYRRHVEKVMWLMEERKREFKSADLIALESDPPCVRKLFESVIPEGKRNVSRYILTVYFKTAGKNIDECKQLILDFNSRCLPPERQEDVLRQVEYLYEHEYHVGCGNFQEYCPGKEHCPLFTKKAAEFSPEEMAEIQEFARDPNLKQRILANMDKTLKCDLTNKELVLDVGVSAYSSNPQNLFMKGPPSTGKTAVTVAVTSYFPEEVCGP